VRALVEKVAAVLAASPSLDDETRADAAREARLLVAGALDWSPGELARRIDQPLADERALPLHERLMTLATRRARGEPLAYVLGAAHFRDLTLCVDARVLIPRPETEVVVEVALQQTRPHPGGVAVDIGTGSGAIAIALATEGHFDQVIATDISADALAVAQRNVAAATPAVPVALRLGADFAPLDGVRARVIVSNPPYIAYDEAVALPASVRDWEPASALFAPDGGMARYHVLLASGARYLEPTGVVVLEVDSRRAVETAALATQYGWDAVQLIRDLSGRDRVLVARRPAD
jgi:release factor glutamine methyltransferase